MKVEKNYKQNNAVYVTMQVLHCIYYSYKEAYPKYLDKEISHLLRSLIDEIEKDYDFPDDADDYNHELYERVTYVTKK